MATGGRFTGTLTSCLQAFTVSACLCRPAEAIFSLPGLEYTYDALEFRIDGRTMMLHVNEHHATDVGELNKALIKHPELQSLDLVTLNRYVGTDKIPADIAAVIRNHAGGHFNHNLFFRTMGRPSNRTLPSEADRRIDNMLGRVPSRYAPSSDLRFGIDDAFGSFEKFKAQFNAAAMGVFGSGWAWLMQHDGHLAVTSTPNNDNPLQAAVVKQSGTPVLAIDMWEHSHYLKYQHRRQEYIDAWWKVINWEVVNQNYELAKTNHIYGPQPVASDVPA